VPGGDVYWFGNVGDLLGWFVERDEGLVPVGVPPFIDLRVSPDGASFVYVDETGTALMVGDAESESEPTSYPVLGMVSALAWSPDGQQVYALVWTDDGSSSLLRVTREDEVVETLREGLDGVWRYGSLAVSADGESLYLSLAGEGPADIEARHRPGPIRELDIYRVDLGSEALEPVVQGPGDDFNPQVIGDYLYWTHNVISDSVVVFPREGGEPWLIAMNAEIPTWSPDGLQIGLTCGGWRLADWGLNLDGGVIEVDQNAQAVSEMRPIVVGYHEDFSPVWSPDGRWIAFHSHRSAEPGSYYSHEGSTDSVYIRRPEAPANTEVSLFDFGWEVGNADWSPDGRRLVFESWDREQPGRSWPWIATINPDTGETLSVDRLPLPADVTNVSWSAWSPEGDKIAVIEVIAGTRRAVWVLGSDGSGAERLLEFDSSTYGGVDWTPDGESLIFGALAGDRMQIFSLPSTGGEPTQLTHDDANLMHPQVSPDGRWIACTRMDQAKELRRTPLR
jgi:Tol biopolymer transport system component